MTDKEKQIEAAREKAKKAADALQAQKNAEAEASGKKAGESVKDGGKKLGTAIHNTAGDVVDGAKNLVSGNKDETADADEKDEHGNPKKKSSGIGDWFKSLNVGGLMGGLLGVAGAWFLGSAFGGGIVGTIASALMSLGGFFVGQKWGSGTINGWLARDKEGKEVEKSPSQQQAVQPIVQQQHSVKKETVGKATSTTMDAGILEVYNNTRSTISGGNYRVENVQSAPSAPVFTQAPAGQNTGRGY